MYTYRRPASPLPRFVLIVGLGLAILLAAFVFSLPRVVETSPQGGAVSSRAPIRLTFSADMDMASIESRLHIEPAVVGAFSWSGRTLTFSPAVEWPGGPVRASLEAGANSTSGLPMVFGANWEFSVGVPGIAYLAETGDVADIWIKPLTPEGAPTRITTERLGVDRFAVSPDGAYFVYAALRADGGADLKRAGRDSGGLPGLLDCSSHRCTAPAFSPDGRRLAFERHPLDRLEASSIEVINLGDGSRATLDGDASHIARFPTFARDGRLAYLNIFEQVIVVHDFNTGESQRIPNTSGEMGAWSPDGQYLMFPEITSEPPPTPGPGTPAPALQIDTFFSHLRRVSVSSGVSEDLSGNFTVEDAGPTYSPSGEWIAFGRKNLDQEQWTPGRQLWLMRADGGEARALTNDSLYNHSNFLWSPDGTVIVYVRFDVTDPASTTELWSISATGAEAQLLATGGYLPEWLP